MKKQLEHLNSQTWVRPEDFYSMRIEADSITLQGAYVTDNLVHYKLMLQIDFKVDDAGFTVGIAWVDGFKYRIVFS
jgi:hypothetical protein